VSNIIWIIVIGFIAGLIARFVSPGPNGPSGFILATVLGIVGAFVATFIGQLIGWYQLDQGAGGALDGSAEMNTWLHKQVMTKVAESGGRVPENLKT
jgi:uncharacterized membrane protein YeaQ/YmgE (transglycosylase-associated protein family)